MLRAACRMHKSPKLTATHMEIFLPEWIIQTNMSTNRVSDGLLHEAGEQSYLRNVLCCHFGRNELRTDIEI